MKKILVIGKLNKSVQDLHESLSGKYNVQICAADLEMVQGMMKIVKPDMVLVCASELEDIDVKIFDELCESYESIPVLVLGTEEGCRKYKKNYEGNQFKYLIRPVSTEALFNKCSEILRMGGGNTWESNRPNRRRKQVLVVDDSALTLRSMKAILELRYDVSVATSGKQAMKAIKKSCPDLILLDYDMPECDGRMMLEMIREDEEIKDIPVVFLTGVADKDHIEAVLKLNPAGYFLKPPKREKLLEAIEDIFRGNWKSL